jgi:hypothetical protein
LKTGKFIEHTPFIWCLIGNIIDEPYAVIDKEIQYVTKHFSPNTKVHCFPTHSGDDYENIKVMAGIEKQTDLFVSLCLPD